jgi:hypothetical protein
MKVSKEHKARILEAYFDKSITREEMELLLSKGTICPPIQWIGEDETETEQETKRRELISRVFGYSITVMPPIEWISPEDPD